jgi:hypothetical protein
MSNRRFPRLFAAGLALAVIAGLFTGGKAFAATVTADVVAIDQPYYLNRLGAFNPDGMMYVLKRDAVTKIANEQAVNMDLDGNELIEDKDVPAALPCSLSPAVEAQCRRILVDAEDPNTGVVVNLERNAALRPDKRPRPIVLRMNEGDTLAVTFENWLAPEIPVIHLPGPPPPNGPFANGPVNAPVRIPERDDQPATREASIHVNGMQLRFNITDDGSFVGRNANSLVCPTNDPFAPLAFACTSGAAAGPRTYSWYGESENIYHLYSMGSITGAEGGGGTMAYGLFGALIVEPAGSVWYRSQSTHEEMTLAQERVGGVPQTHTGGQPKIDYEATYPDDCVEQTDAGTNLPIPDTIDVNASGVYCLEGKAGLPILEMLDGNEIVHADIHAIIAGPPPTYQIASRTNKSTSVNPEQNRPFREVASIWNDEQVALQAFNQFYSDPVLGHTMHGGRDGFMINYASNGIGSEVIANRLGVGPMWDCVECKAEEFFLTSWAVGDPGMLVDVPAIFADPTLGGPGGPIARTALYPEDPGNVHHAYLNDHTKMRNVHAGPFEHHIFHMHAHQWVFAPYSDKANYQDMQQIGPGSGYTFDLSNGGAGNRHKTPGDAIYHCHFYPHFAQGMWALFRVHEVYELGTEVEGEVTRDVWTMREGFPVEGARALVDGEVVPDGTATSNCSIGGNDYRGICRGTPIPWTVPMPGYALAPLPGGNARIYPPDPRRWEIDLSPADVTAGLTPGFPFYVPGIGGRRPPSPPMDLIADGGLPRHVVTSPQVLGTTADWVVTRLDLNKELLEITAEQIPEGGTPAELATINFHKAAKVTVPAGGLYPGLNLPGYLTKTAGVPAGQPALFEVNGLPPQAGAPFADPCRDNAGNAIRTGNNKPKWFTQNGLADAAGNTFYVLPEKVQFSANNPRKYNIANIQLDVIFNKAGWHHPQQRIITLWDDVDPTYLGTRPSEPMVFRINTLDCARIYHTNLTPNFFELDDYEVRFPTDIIGQHVHMPKFDVTTSDGAANGWNYEDGTFSPGEVIERIHAINDGGGLIPIGGGAPITDLEATTTPLLSGITQIDTTGARVTVQRWMADPVLDNLGKDRGFNNSFTHDHFGPSTFQQLGLYATVLSEPARSDWYHNETGVALGTRQGTTGDGGPTSWQAVIEPPSGSSEKPYREFYFEFSDFQSAYDRGWDGVIDADSFLFAKNVSVRVDPNTGNDDLDEHRIVQFPGICPGGVPRPCPEVISLSDPGIFVVNYRSEPVGQRVYDPNRPNPKDPGTDGFQAEGKRGDLAFALESRDDRAIPELNVPMATCVRATPQFPGVIRPPGDGIAGAADLDFTNDFPVGVSYPLGAELACPPLNAGAHPGDPATPTARAYIGDRVKVRAQVGATEESHFFTVHGVKWLMNYDDPLSGFRNTQSMGISEQFQFDFPIFSELPGAGNTADFYYASDTSNAGLWNGTWGLMRAYNRRLNDLVQLSDNPMFPAGIDVVNAGDFIDGVCPVTNPDTEEPTFIRTFDITAVAARDVLPVDPDVGIRTLVYNTRETTIPNNGFFQGGQGPLHDPTALLYVHTADLVVEGLAPGTDPATLPGTCFTPVEVFDPLLGINVTVLQFNEAGCPVALGCFKGTASALLPDSFTSVPSFNSNLLGCPVDLDPSAPVEPLIIRANAGDCIQVTLRNKLQTAPDSLGHQQPQLDIAGATNYPPVIDRLVDGAVPEKFTFNANDTAPSSIVGLHPQLVAWYAGDLRAKNVGRRRNRAQLELTATPVEFGATGLIPADKMEQSGKGMVGAMIINPPGTSCIEDPGTRAQATCNAPDVDPWRDLVAVTQTAVNLQYNTTNAGPPEGVPNPDLESFRSVQNFKAEGAGAPADDEDSGHRGINYGSEPLWFRIGQFPPHLPLEDQRTFQNANVLSNVAVAQGTPGDADFADCATNVNQDKCDPQTAVFTATSGDAVRMRFVEPGGGSRRAHGIKVHGHLWERAPYEQVFSVDGRPVGPRRLGTNPTSQKIGIQIGYGSQNHFDLLFPAGGFYGVTGDYFTGMQDPTANFTGMWGILRVEDEE